MNTLKRISAVILALVMVLALGVTAFALTDGSSNTEYKIVITPKDASADAEVRSYEAYQIFAGDITNGKLVNIEWGNGVKNTSALVAELKNVEPFKTQLTAENPTAEDVADVLSKATSEQMPDIADVFAKYLDTVAGTSAPGTSADGTEGKDVIKVKGSGYYMVVDKSDLDGEDDDVDATGKANSRYMLDVVGDVAITAKVDAPSVEKDIVTGPKYEDTAKHNEVAIGDTITYRLTGTIPDTTGYNRYWYVMHDKLSKGLTYSGDSTVHLYVVDDTKEPVEKTELTPLSDYISIEQGKDGDKTTLDFIFKDFIEKIAEKYPGKKVAIEFEATLNENAEVTANGNPNEVDLEYSNNPNEEYDGDKPDGEKPTGKTPEKTVTTLTTGLELHKYYTDNTGKHDLAGAKFRLKGTKLNKVVTTGTEYVAYTEEDSANAAEYKYWKLKDGSFTETAPSDPGIDSSVYEEPTTTKYKKVDYTKEVITQEETEITVFVDENGNIDFAGLAPGRYLIEEVVAPNGYNKLKYAIVVEIGCEEWDATGGEDHLGAYKKWWYKETTVDYVNGELPDDFDIDEVDLANAEKHYYYDLDAEPAVKADCPVIEVENKSGLELPSTGGMGTTIFYIVGGIMLLAAMAVCASKVLSPKVKSTKNI